MLYICGRWCSRARRCLQGSMASAADDMQRRSRALAAGRPMGREGKTFPKIFQKMPFKSLWNHKNPDKQRDCGQCGRTMVEQSDPSHLYIYASCVCVRARKGDVVRQACRMIGRHFRRTARHRSSQAHGRRAAGMPKTPGGVDHRRKVQQYNSHMRGLPF